MKNKLMEIYKKAQSSEPIVSKEQGQGVILTGRQVKVILTC